MRNLLNLMSTALTLICTTQGFAAVPTWKPVADAVPMVAIAFDAAGTRYAITPNGGLISKVNGIAPWTPEAIRGRVKFVTVLKDGTVLALNASQPFIYSKAGGKWTTTDGFAEAMLRTMNGISYARFQDGTVTSSDGFQFKAKFTSIEMPSDADNYLLLTGVDNKIYGYEPGSKFQPMPYNWQVPAKMFVGKSGGTRGSMFLLGAGFDATVYFFEVTPKNGWTPIAGPGMKFIAMSKQGTLYGIDLNSKLYWLDAKF